MDQTEANEDRLGPKYFYIWGNFAQKKRITELVLVES